MNDERIEILKMVSDKVISVDEAERLLRALDDGERKRTEPRRSVGVASAFDGVSEVISTIGHVVQSTVDDAMEGVELGLRSFDTEDDDSGADLGSSDFEIPEGERLVVRRSSRLPGPMSGSALTLLPAEGTRCTIEASDGAGVRTRRRGDQTRIQWRHGPLTIRVPATVSGVDAKVLGGDLTVCALTCPLDAQVMGGRVELVGLRRPFDCKAMGGDIALGLHAGLTGSSRARSVGGNVVVTVADGVDARVVASATGGEVRADPSVGRVRRDGNRIHRRTTIGLGLDSDGAAEIALETIGGDVVVQREQR